MASGLPFSNVEIETLALESRANLDEDGGVSPDGRAFAVEAAGVNIWQWENRFHYVYRSVEGDDSLTARLVSFDPAHRSSKAGVMIRGRLSEHSGQAFVGLRAAHGSEFLWASAPDDPTEDVQTHDEAGLPYWYRIERAGDELIGYASPDGEQWREIGRETVDVGKEAYVGLAVCSLDPNNLARATFDRVSGLDTWDNADIGDVRLEGSVRIENDE